MKTVGKINLCTGFFLKPGPTLELNRQTDKRGRPAIFDQSRGKKQFSGDKVGRVSEAENKTEFRRRKKTEHESQRRHQVKCVARSSRQKIRNTFTQNEDGDTEFDD